LEIGDEDELAVALDGGELAEGEVDGGVEGSGFGAGLAGFEEVGEEGEVRAGFGECCGGLSVDPDDVGGGGFGGFEELGGLGGCCVEAAAGAFACGHGGGAVDDDDGGGFSAWEAGSVGDEEG
jgi:hypothetical protein